MSKELFLAYDIISVYAAENANLRRTVSLLERTVLGVGVEVRTNPVIYKLAKQLEGFRRSEAAKGPHLCEGVPWEAERRARRQRARRAAPHEPVD